MLDKATSESTVNTNTENLIQESGTLQPVPSEPTASQTEKPLSIEQLKEIAQAIQTRDKKKLDALLPEKLTEEYAQYFDQSALPETKRLFVDSLLGNFTDNQTAATFYSGNAATRLALLKELEQKTDTYLAQHQEDKRAIQEAAAAYASLAQNLYDFNPNKAMVEYAYHLAKKADALFTQHNSPEYTELLEWDENNLSEKYKSRTPYEKRIKLYKESGAQADILLQKIESIQDNNKIERLKDLNYFGEHFWCRMFINEYNNGQQMPFNNPVLNEVLYGYSAIRAKIAKYEGRNSLLEGTNLSSKQAPYQGKNLFELKLIQDQRYDELRFEGFKAILSVLDHIEEKAKPNPKTHLAILGKKAAYVSGLQNSHIHVYPLSKQAYVDFAKSYIETILDSYTGLPEELKLSEYGRRITDTIAGAIASFQSLENTEGVTSQHLKTLYTKALTIFAYDKSSVLLPSGGVKRILVNLGRIAFEEGNYTDTIRYIEQVLALDNDKLFKAVDGRSTKSLKTPYELLAIAYRKTGQEAKIIPFLEKQQRAILRGITTEHYYNQQLDLKEVLSPYYKDYPEYGLDILNKAGFTEKTNWHERTLSHGKNADNSVLIRMIGKLIGNSHDMVRAYANSGQHDKAKQLFDQLSTTVDTIEKLSQSHKVDFSKFGRGALHELVRKKVEAAQFLADHGIENNVLVKLKLGNPSEQNNLLDTLLTATYLDKRFASADRLAAVTGFFKKLCMSPYTTKLMEVAQRGAKGEYGLAEPLRIFLENKPHWMGLQGVEYPTEDKVHVYMQFSGRPNQPGSDGKQMIDNFNTLCHELTHYVTDRMYDNDAKPYALEQKPWTKAVHAYFTASIKEDRNVMNEYLAQRDRAEHQAANLIAGRVGIDHLGVWDGFDVAHYHSAQADGEYIARFFGELAKESYKVGNNAAWNVIEEALPQFSKYVRDVYMPDLETFIAQHDQKMAAQKAPVEQTKAQVAASEPTGATKPVLGAWTAKESSTKTVEKSLSV